MARDGPKKELTQERFAKFLAWLNPVAEKAGEEYERLRFRLMTYFSNRKCRFSEDLADETINRVILKINSEKIEKKLAFCYGVARNVFLESLRKEKKHQNIDELQVKSEDEETEDSPYKECLDKCLKKLPKESRNLILDYFSESKQAKVDLHKKMSDALGISKTALRMKILRIKKKLKMCIQKCLAF
jgi:RNA polymerase sigma factor (sigma-70 family)